MQRYYGIRAWPIQGPVVVRYGWGKRVEEELWLGKKSRRRVKFVLYPLGRGKII